jgi:hypothetical protein
MNEGLPMVTIGIPTFNRAELLAVALRSALDQTYPNVEVIVSDNASTDQTQEHCARLARSDPRLRYLRQDKNLGATANFQSALEESCGEYFMWLADDDWIEPNYVEVCEEFLRRDESLQLVSGMASYHRSGKQVFMGETIRLLDPDPCNRVLGYYQSVIWNGVFYGLARTATMRSTIPLQSRFGADWMLVASVAFRGGVLTVPMTTIHRSVEGASYDVRRLAPVWARSVPGLPHLSIGLSVIKELSTAPVYDSLSRTARLVLGARVFWTMLKRFSVPTARRWPRQKLAHILGRALPGHIYQKLKLPYDRWFQKGRL